MTEKKREPAWAAKYALQLVRETHSVSLRTAAGVRTEELSMFDQVQKTMELLRAAQRFIKVQANSPPMSGGYIEALSELSESVDNLSRLVGGDSTFTCEICGKQTAESFDGENDWCVACGDREFWHQFRKQELAYQAHKEHRASEEQYYSQLEKEERLRDMADEIRKERLENQVFCEKMSDPCDNMPDNQEEE